MTFLKKIIQKEKIFFALFCFVFSFLMLYICTASSPRYAINPWNDSNAFFTMGKAMANGLTMYKDIFEQKGPLLYLIHCIGYWISNTSFTGVYILESISFAITLFFVYKITSLYLKPTASFIIIPVFSLISLNSTTFYYGDSAEEFILPMLMISLYYLLTYLKNGNLDRKVYLFVGFLAGCVLMTKFTVIGFWFGWMAYIALHNLFTKNVKDAFVNSFVFLGGMAVAVIPWVIYFAIKGGLYDFINTYFLINATAYTSESVSVFKRIFKMFYNYMTTLGYAPVVFILSVAGTFFALFVKSFGEKFYLRLAITVVYICGAFFVYVGGVKYEYYYFIFVAFIPLVLIAIGIRLKKFANKTNQKNLLTAFVCLIVIAGSLFASNQINVSSRVVHRNREDTVQYKFLQYISQKDEDAVLLNYGMLDAGFYVFNDTLPAFKHFEKQNISAGRYSENMSEQKRYIEEKLADYIVCGSSSKTRLEEIYAENPTMKDNYVLVNQETEKMVKAGELFETQDRMYYLFELKK